MSETIQITEQEFLELQRLAYHDELTGLYNRNWMQLAKPTVPSTAIALIDLNDFKRVNDSLGHNAGDQVLKQFADDLQFQATKFGCDVVRLGGDEFVLLGIKSQYVMAVQSFIATWIGSYNVTASIGFAHFDVNLSISLGEADKEMYANKASRKSKDRRKNDR